MRKGILSLLVAAIAWSWPNVLIRMLRLDFDMFTQSFFRYIAADIFLFAIGILFMRSKIVHAALNLKLLLIPALIMSANQIFYTAGVYMTSAVVSNLMGRLNAILIPVLSYVFYEDERRVVRDRRFLAGAFLAIVGVIGIVIGKEQDIEGFNVGALFTVFAAASWSIYAIYIKKIVRSIDPLAIIAFVSLISILIFFPIVLLFGDIGKIVRVSSGCRLLLFASGILGVGVGNIFYYHAIKYVGTSIASIFFLLLPLSVGTLAFLVLGETLTFLQVISGFVLISGCWVVTRLVREIHMESSSKKGG